MEAGAPRASMRSACNLALSVSQTRTSLRPVTLESITLSVQVHLVLKMLSGNCHKVLLKTAARFKVVLWT